MKYISLFSGIGGFDLALDRLGHECLYANDFDKYAAKVYNNRFNRQIDSRDIRLVKTDELPDFDLLVGGFPCQAFSIAGKRLGFEDTRGTLFFEIARIIKDKRPKYFLLENVKGLLNHNGGETFQAILATINELGYECEWQILNSKNHGVPQNRERIFISGYIRGEPRPKIFPIRRTNTENTYSRKVNKVVIPTINPDRENIRQSRRFKENGDVSYTLVCQFVNGVMIYEPVVHNLQTRNPNRPSLTRLCDCNSGKLYQKCCGTPAGSGHISKSDGTTYCLDTGNSQGIEYKGKIRRLTEIECERLQGFPDNWTEGISSTQRYKALGNAVTVNVIYDICKGYNEQH
jgi:DNA (cytosine-5)-methyltransferase 1